jgi:hypothetical protein
MSSSISSDERPKFSPEQSLDQGVTTISTVFGPYGVRHAHYMGLSGSALRTAIGITAGMSFLAFGYGQGKRTSRQLILQRSKTNHYSR